jgi:hypothetical protein
MISFADHFGAGGTLPGKARSRRAPEVPADPVPSPIPAPTPRTPNQPAARPDPGGALEFDIQGMIERWKVHYTRIYQPDSPVDEHFIQMMAYAAYHVEQCERYRQLLLQHVDQSADEFWNADRRKEAEKLAASLAKSPGRVAKALEKTKQGAEWKIDRWKRLHLILTRLGAWGEDERKHAFDLLGIPSRSRKKSTVVPEGTDVQGLLQLVSREVARLRELISTILAAQDQNAYAEARLSGLSPYDERLFRLQKDEARWSKMLRDAEKAMLSSRKRFPPRGGPKAP